MPELGVTVVVMRDDHVLLTKREDFDVWCLPGGAVDAHESLDQAAQREVYEETGIAISLTRLIGICSKPFWSTHGTHSIIFAAQPASHHFAPDPHEVTDLAYFPYQQLPEPLLWEHHAYIEPAFSGKSGLVWSHTIQMPPELADRAALYRWRDSIGVSRQQAYMMLLQLIGPHTLTCIMGM